MGWVVVRLLASLNYNYGCLAGLPGERVSTGHHGQAGYDFFLHQQEVLNDWGYRDVHV